MCNSSSSSTKVTHKIYLHICRPMSFAVTCPYSPQGERIQIRIICKKKRTAGTRSNTYKMTPVSNWFPYMPLYYLHIYTNILQILRLPGLQLTTYNYPYLRLLSCKCYGWFVYMCRKYGCITMIFKSRNRI